MVKQDIAKKDVRNKGLKFISSVFKTSFICMFSIMCFFNTLLIIFILFKSGYFGLADMLDRIFFFCVGVGALHLILNFIDFLTDKHGR